MLTLRLKSINGTELSYSLKTVKNIIMKHDWLFVPKKKRNIWLIKDRETHTKKWARRTWRYLVRIHCEEEALMIPKYNCWGFRLVRVKRCDPVRYIEWSRVLCIVLTPQWWGTFVILRSIYRYSKNGPMCLLFLWDNK